MDPHRESSIHQHHPSFILPDTLTNWSTFPTHHFNPSPTVTHHSHPLATLTNHTFPVTSIPSSHLPPSTTRHLSQAVILTQITSTTTHRPLLPNLPSPASLHLPNPPFQWPLTTCHLDPNYNPNYPSLLPNLPSLTSPLDNLTCPTAVTHLSVLIFPYLP